MAVMVLSCCLSRSFCSSGGLLSNRAERSVSSGSLRIRGALFSLDRLSWPDNLPPVRYPLGNCRENNELLETVLGTRNRVPGQIVYPFPIPAS
jgi:hypothetical protein